MERGLDLDALLVARLGGIGGGGGEGGGADGASAYQVAVNNGFEGTVTEWLASLQGEDYVLTDEDKAEIAELVLASLPAAEEASF